MKKVLLVLLISLLAISGCASKKEKVETNKVSTTLMANDALNSIKDVHPGTAGCSLKAMYAIKDIMSLATSNEYVDISMQKFVDSLDKNAKEDFKESVNFVKGSFKEIDSKNPKKVFEDQGIEIGSLDISTMNYDYAKDFLDKLSDLVDRDFSND